MDVFPAGLLYLEGDSAWWWQEGVVNIKLSSGLSNQILSPKLSKWYYLKIRTNQYYLIKRY